MMEAFMVWGLPVLQSLVATGISQVALLDMYSDDGSENDDFRRIMREAFTDAVKRVRKDSNDTQQKATIANEFKYYQKVLIDELIKMEPTDRKKYIEQELYTTFKEEVLKRGDFLQNINMKLAQVAIQKQQQYILIIDKMHQLLTETYQKLDTIITDSLKKSALTGLCPSSITDAEDDYALYIPSLHAARYNLVNDISGKLQEHRSVLLYAGFKEGKTVTAALLSKYVKDYRIVWLDFAQENRLNLEVILGQYRNEDKLLFVLDNIRYENDALYEKLCQIVANKKGENWLFVVGCYEKLSEVLFENEIIPYEYYLPSLTEEEVGEMIPDDKKMTYQKFIFNLFEGQPMLTHMACVYLQEHGWGTSEKEMGHLFTFPKGTPTEKKVKRMARKMMKDDDYALVNRLLLLDKSFTAEDCEELANVNPIIINPQQKLESLCRIWVKEENGRYSLSPLLRKTLSTDMLPQERKDCCNLIARKIIHHPGGITPSDAIRALNMLITAKSSDDVATFYVLMLTKLEESNILDHEASMLWKSIWVNVQLPEWMSIENKALIRNTQLLLLVMRHNIESQPIVDDLEHLIKLMDNKSEVKAACVRVLIGYFLLNNKVDKLPQYKALSAQLPVIAGTFDHADEEKFIFVALDNVRSAAELLSWAKSYKDAGEPNIELIPDGVIMKINMICDQTEEPQRVDVVTTIMRKAVDSGFEIVAVVACARLLDLFSVAKDVEKAKKVMEQYGSLADTKLGSLLVNYSYGLCLNNNGLAEEGYDFVEKACTTNDLALASAVLLNASATLAEMKAKKGDKAGALNVIEKLVHHPDFGYCYTDYEKGSAYGTLAYSYWEAGEKVAATHELLKVENILWEHREKRDDDFKNLSMRYSVLALYMTNEAVGRRNDERFAQPDYGLFTKIVPSLLEGYKPERNFTVLYGLYHLSELILDDERTSLRILEHMYEMQRTDAVNMASLLSALMQAYPLFVLNDREDMMEYAVLTSLAGGQVSKNKRLESFESFVLVNAIATLVMKRVLLIADGKDTDDDLMWGMIDKAIEILPQHQLTDRISMQMKSDNPDYSVLKEFHEWGIVVAYHVMDITPAMGLSAMYILVKTLLEPNTFPTATKLANRFVKSFAYLLVKQNENKFTLELRDFEKYFSRANGKNGMTYLRSVMQGLYLKLKTEPVLDKDIMRFIEI